MKTFAFKFVYVDRKVGPKHQHLRQSASSFPVAMNRAAKSFLRDKTRKERNDLWTSGVKIEAVLVGDAVQE